MTAQIGDWVRLRATQPVSFTDHLGGTGLRPGTKGVVTATYGSRVQVDFDSGFGTVSAWVPRRRLRTVRRRGGVEQFRTRTSRRTVARVAVAIFLAWPVIQFVAVYVWTNRGFDGLVESFALGVVDSVVEWLGMLVTQPVQMLVYLGFLGILSRIAWR